MSKKLDAAIDALVDVLATLPEHELEGWQPARGCAFCASLAGAIRYRAGDGAGTPQIGLNALPSPPGLRAGTPWLPIYPVERRWSAIS
jgi:hypothetical protein